MRSVVRGIPVTCQGGGKKVHAADVAKAAALLLTAPDVAGEVYDCYDRYTSQYEATPRKCRKLVDAKAAGLLESASWWISAG